MGKRGPTPWQPTEDQRDKVSILAAARFSIETIAKIIGISHMTLRKAFVEEINEGREVQMAKNRLRLVKAAETGSVPAIKYLDECLRRDAAQADIDEDTHGVVKSTDRRVGKKEEKADAARRAMEGEDSEWGADLKPNTLQ
jgi:hypothetical protein